MYLKPFQGFSHEDFTFIQYLIPQKTCMYSMWTTWIVISQGSRHRKLTPG